jgi:hypothetical protein
MPKLIVICLLMVPIVLAQNLTATSSSNDTTPQYIGFSYGGTTRSTMVLLWSCFTTIFACTWTVVHHNMPDPNDSTLRIYSRKLLWMLITIIAPEFTFGVALQQFADCWEFREKMRANGYPNWTLSHSFYVDMGGYGVPVVGSEGGIQTRTLQMVEVERLYKKDVSSKFHIPEYSRKEIMAFGKADGFAKLFTCLQSGWLVVQSIARRIQHLPISELEIATLALIASAFIIYILWWNKPYDANQQTIIRPIDTVDMESTLYMVTRGSVGKSTGILAVHFEDIFSLMAGSACFGALFGGIHCIGWNFYFLTKTEQYLWRSCSILVASTLMASFAALVLFSFSLDDALRDWAVIIVGFVSFVLYIGARLILIFQTFYCLRSQPVDVYRSAAWINFIPHVG